tara:strand:+ start:834 stop:1169 length:336 start_codon:yes stop_codon:yes gene_type:complete
MIYFLTKVYFHVDDDDPFDDNMSESIEADLSADECVNSVWLVPDDKDPKEFIQDKLLDWHGYYCEDDDIEIEPMEVEDLIHEYNVLNSTHRTTRFELRNVLHMMDGGLAFA